MSEFYDGMASVAVDLLAEFGRVVTITRTTESIDPVTGAAGTPVLLSGSFTVINPPASGGTVQAFDNRLMGEAALITDNLRFLIIAAGNAPFPPAALDVVAMDGRNWEILGVTPVAPDGTPIIYKAGMRA